MSDKDELREAIVSVKDEQAQQQADATETAQARKYRASVDAAAIEKFVRDILPGVVEPLLSEVGKIAKKPVRTASGNPANQFDGDHQDWHYAFEVGGAEAVVESCGDRLEVSVNGRQVDYTDTLDHDGALRFFNGVVKLGLRTQR